MVFDGVKFLMVFCENLSMISTTFSMTSHLSSFINGKRDSKQFLEREVITRVASCALSVLALFDATIQAFGAIESTVFACLKAVVNLKHPGFSDVLKHFRCVLIYLKTVPFISLSCVLKPSHLKSYEQEVVNCINVLLLSRDTKYSKECTVDPLEIVKYLQKQTANIDPKHLEGMEETLELLNDAKKFLTKPLLSEIKSIFCKTKLTPKITSNIECLRQHQNMLIRECATRLISIGLSITCAIDVTIMVTFDIFLSLVPMSFEMLTGTFDFHFYLKFYITHFRDLFTKIFGICSGSVVGVISPYLAIELVNPESSFYRNFHFFEELPVETPVERLGALENNKSLLVPIIHRVPESLHIIYCLITKTNNRFNMSMLNKGTGTEKALLSNAVLTKIRGGADPLTLEFVDKFCERASDEKQIVNVTYNNLSEEVVKSYLEGISAFSEDVSMSEQRGPLT